MLAIDIVLYILIFCIGTLFGSFFTLAVYRIPLEKNITHERSFCPNCNHKLSFLDMIPILSYICLGGKCRYCKQKIRIRYLLLEVLTGLVFVLFAMSIKFNILEMHISTIVHLICGLLYLATLFIIAGIDKEKIQIEKNVILFGYIVEILYILYLYIVENDSNIYRYVIYLIIICFLVILDIEFLRQRAKDSYPIESLLLCMLFITFTYEIVTILTIIMTLLIIAFKILFEQIIAQKRKSVRITKKEIRKMPIAFYLCVSNIFCLLITNFCVFYLL